jgi:sigma-E factor negative regulatory protein RseC
MTETGRISAIEGGVIIIQQDSFQAVKSGEACSGCLNQECKEKEGLISASNPLNLPLRVGQQVETEMSSKMIIGQGFLALLPPLAGFIAGFLLEGLMFPSFGEPGRAFGGLILMFAGAFGFYFYRRRHPVKILPKVIRIVAPAETSL